MLLARTIVTTMLAGTVPAVALAEPSVVTHPVTGSACGIASVVFRAEGAGAGPISYQWQVESPQMEGGWAWIEPVYWPGDMRTRYLYIDNPDGSSSLRVVPHMLDDATRYRCVISDAFGSVATRPAALVLLSADVGGPGGVAGADGVMDNNDFVAFIAAFFEGRVWADLGSAGGVTGPDGALDTNDFVAFIGLFFDGCTELHGPELPPPQP